MIQDSELNMIFDEESEFEGLSQNCFPNNLDIPKQYEVSQHPKIFNPLIPKQFRFKIKSKKRI